MHKSTLRLATLVGGFCILIAAAQGLLADKQRQPAPTTPAVADSDNPDIERWQGRFIRATGDKLFVKIEGEQEFFLVADDATITRNRRPAEVSSLVRGDFANLQTIGQGEKEVVVSIRAFALR